MKTMLKVSFFLMSVTTFVFGNAFIKPLQNVHNLLQDDITRAIAGILIILAGFYVASGNFEKGKVYAWGLIIGISLVFGASEIATAIWGS